MGNTHKAYSIDVYKDDGCRCSSDERLVMSVERRTADIQFQTIKQLIKVRMKDLFETKSKPIPITKDMVREAYRKVKANKGSAGVDAVSLEKFDEDISKNLYKIWNRMASGKSGRYQVLLELLHLAEGKRERSSLINLLSLGNRIQITFLALCCPKLN